MKVSAVVFDIGNVLIGWTPEQFFDAKIGLLIPPTNDKIYGIPRKAEDSL